MKASGLLMVLILPCTSAASTPRTYYVSPTGSATYPFSTPETAATVIQDAVDAAQYGDVVQLMPGEYRQRAVLRPGLRFWGSGPESTAIVAPQHGLTEAAVGGAEAAEVRGIRFVQEPGGVSNSAQAIDLGPYSNQVVAHCAVYGGFRGGISCGTVAQGGPALIYQCTFEGPGGGVYTGRGAGVVVDSCRFSHVSGGGGSVLLRRCRFEAAPLNFGAGDVLIDSCLFADPGGYLPSIGLQAPCSLRMANCIISGKDLALVVNVADNVEIYNCTFVNEDYAIFCDPAVRVVLRNTILWGPAPQLWGANPASFDVLYCDVAGGWEGEGNIDADPMFVGQDKGDFRLRPDSPCVDAGTPSWVDTPAWLPGADFVGRPRVMYGGRSDWRRPDMGAYEYYIQRLLPGPLADQTTLTWSSTFYESYSVFYSDDLVTWHLADDTVGPGYDEVVLSWIDDGSKTGIAPSLVPRRFYRILENP